MILVAELPDLAPNAGAPSAQVTLTTVTALEVRLISERMARLHNFQRDERRVGTRTRISRGSRNHDWICVSQSRGGPADDCDAAIVGWGGSSASSSQTPRTIRKPSHACPSSATIRRGILIRKLSSMLNKSPRNEYILALPH